MHTTTDFPRLSPAQPTNHRVRFEIGGTSQPLGAGAGAEAVWEQTTPPRKSVPQAVAGRLAASLEYMETYLNQPLKVTDLCAMVGLSESRYFELFKIATGTSPLNWLIRARMNRAGELLQASDLQIKQIAGQVGYEDPFYFSRLFKTVHGVSPSQYRLQNQEAVLASSLAGPDA
jgi:transcriptional regulator GlxA family with amidase domain